MAFSEVTPRLNRALGGGRVGNVMLIADILCRAGRRAYLLLYFNVLKCSSREKGHDGANIVQVAVQCSRSATAILGLGRSDCALHAASLGRREITPDGGFGRRQTMASVAEGARANAGTRQARNEHRRARFRVAAPAQSRTSRSRTGACLSPRRTAERTRPSPRSAPRP